MFKDEEIVIEKLIRLFLVPIFFLGVLSIQTRRSGGSLTVAAEDLTYDDASRGGSRWQR